MSHRYPIPVLAGHNLQDMRFSTFLSLYQSICCSANEHVNLISKIAKIDSRRLINNNLQTIASQWHIHILDLINGVAVATPNLADKFCMIFRNICYVY